MLFIGLAARWMRRRAAAPAGMPMPGYGGAGAMPMGGYGPGAAPSNGPGLMGVGLAAAGGVAAGMLAERMLHGGGDHTASRGDGYAPGGAFEGSRHDLGAANDLASRDIDFGSGDSWDAGGGGGRLWRQRWRRRRRLVNRPPAPACAHCPTGRACRPVCFAGRL